MGICCSKTTPKLSHPTLIEKRPNPNPQIDKTIEEKSNTKEKSIINDSKSNQVDLHSVVEIEKPDKNLISEQTNLVSEISSDSGTNCNLNSNPINNGSAIVRTSSCTRDEVEAILIQCGRLSRSSSAVQTPVSGRKYSGSKRSYDFDQEAETADVETERESRRQSRPSPNRRRTPSRERERERNNNGGGRRVSRSPGRRSESPIATCHNPSRPGKMVSVPATAAVVKKVAAVKKVASPCRSRSPAARTNARVGNDNQNQSQGGLLSLSRSNSRKAEQSPYRRNPLGEIDQNSQKQGLDNLKNSRTKTKEPLQADENGKASPQMTNNIAINVVVASGTEPHKTQALSRTRSSRLSRDLDNLNLEPQNISPPSSYTTLLLEDIQNFHNKTPTTESLPQGLSKACSILDEIADLNSSNGSVRVPTREIDANKLLKSKEPHLVETEIVAMNDLLEPSFQKYVTVKRGNVGREEEDDESSGSNSFTGGPQHLISSSLWETNSIDSTDCWASSSRSNTRNEDRKKRGIDCANSGIGPGRLIRLSPAVTTATI